MRISDWSSDVCSSDLFHESVKVEIAWTIAPFIILLALAIPAAGTLIKMEDTRNSDLTVKVTGYQWKWQYEYVGENVSYFSTLNAASKAARPVGAHGRGIDGSFSRSEEHTSELDQIKR